MTDSNNGLSTPSSNELPDSNQSNQFDSNDDDDMTDETGTQSNQPSSNKGHTNQTPVFTEKKGRYINRDLNAAMNILYIGKYMIQNGGKRPKVFCYAN